MPRVTAVSTPPGSRDVLVDPRDAWKGSARTSARMRKIDRVEFKGIVGSPVPSGPRRDRPRRREDRRVCYFDTVDLDLARRGIVVRARRIRAGADVVVKVRRDVGRERPAQLAHRIRRSPHLSVEVDALPGTVTWTAAVTSPIRRSALERVLHGGRDLRSLLSAEQRAFLRHLGLGECEDLVALGPVAVVRTTLGVLDCGSRMVLETWRYPDDSRLIEVSTKCAPRRAARVAAEAGTFLADRGIGLSATQLTKTRASLEYFSRMRA